MVMRQIVQCLCCTGWATDGGFGHVLVLKKNITMVNEVKLEGVLHCMWSQEDL